MKKTRFLASILTVILLLSVLAGCGGKTPSESAPSGDDKETPAKAEKTDYKYGKIDIPGKDGALCGAPIYIAYDQGFFAEEGFDVNLISADTETRKIGLNNGTIPIVNGDFQFFPSIEEGVKVKVVDGLHNGCITIVVPEGSDIKTAADLKGKKVGVDEIGGTPYQVASLWLENAGVVAKDNKDVTFVPYSDGNLEIEAAKKGEIDAAAIWDPFGSLAVQNENFTKIFDLSTDPLFAGKYCCFLYASEKVLDEDPEKVEALLRAYNKAQEWINDNPEETVDIIIENKYSSIEDRDLAVELVKSYEYPSHAEHTSGETHVQADVLYFVEELAKVGYLKTTDPQAFADQIYSDINKAN
ncbi:MAG: ABC transporter substrate-binding protein [Clostridiales Family XIII bacterium]|jgi:NitT/TauT family transport system substrate-binding protein|nr:ABC transporter substrate-binding protein [Clostridiales Family XIII bacterium]